MTRDKIKRINELAQKSKLTGLSVKEQEEQFRLRKEYINDMKTNFIKSMENVVITDRDGNQKRVRSRLRSTDDPGDIQ